MSSVSSTTSLISNSVSSTATSSTKTSSGTTSTSSSSTGSSSDIDWSALITLAVDAKLSKADTVDVKIASNEAKVAAYQSLQSLLSGLATASSALRAPSGSSLASSDVFSNRSAYLTTSNGVSASATMAATVESGAEIGSHEIVIEQLAKAHKVAGGSIASKSTDLGLDGVLSLGSGDKLASVTISADMSLAEIAEAINGASAASGISASILAVSGNDYRLVLTATETGLPMTVADALGDGALDSLGLIAADGSFANPLQEARSAIFTVDGLQITRTSNDVADVLDGVTLHLYAASDEPLTLEVATDLGAVKEAIVALVDAYNAYRDFAYGQQQIPNANNADSTVLFGDGTLRSINAQMSDAISARIGAEGMALLGLSFDATNRLELDEDVLDAALLNNLGGIEDLLSFQFSASTTNLMLLTRGTTDLGEFTLDVVADSSGKLISASVGGDEDLFTVAGTRIVGREGTKYAGYVFVYAGSSSQSISASTQTGLAEMVYNSAKSASDSSNGPLSGLISDIETYNLDLQAKSDDIRSRAKTYEDNLKTLYARYQAAIETAQSSLDYLSTLIDTWNSSS